MKNWGIYVLAVLGFVGYEAMTSADRDSTGAIVSGGSVDAFNVQVGDCFDDSNSFGDEISSLPGVPCADPHDNETYAVINLTMANYPDEAMEELAYDSCMERFEPFVGRDYETSSLDIFTMYPSADTWKQDDREVVCAVYDMDTNKLVGSVQGMSL